ncbi:hypothetical protein [Pseudomonas aeruginosa]|uniref:hypothetical protein n=1 Tax=Pseudomonas aeruginosa TaxID=287 RepID=UPI00117A15BC|nr:hypothetical protein [Pseudomonas aeruginosa]
MRYFAKQEGSAMWGLSFDQWGVINGFANWLSAIATISAVIVSLWLAMRTGKRKGKLSVTIMVIAERGATVHPRYLTFHLVNTGDRSFYATAVGWYFGGKRNRRHFVQLIDMRESSPLPMVIQPGEFGRWMFSVDDGGWFSSWKDELQGKESNLKTLRAIVSTSTGEDFVCTPHESVLSGIREHFKERPAD